MQIDIFVKFDLKHLICEKISRLATLCYFDKHLSKFKNLIGKLNYVSLKLLAGVVVEGALLVHELHHPDLVSLHIEVAQSCLLRFELARPVAL